MFQLPLGRVGSSPRQAAMHQTRAGAHLALSLQEEQPQRVCLFPEVSPKYGLEGDETWWPGVKPQCQAKIDAEIFM